MSDVAVVLTKAHDLLVEHGWTKGMMLTSHGKRCTLGALTTACDELYGKLDRDIGERGRLWLETRQRASQRLVEVWDRQDIPSWHTPESMVMALNDDDGTTKEDVLLAFKKAIALTEEG